MGNVAAVASCVAKMMNRLALKASATVVAVLVAALLTGADRGNGQGFPILLQITSPADGVIVNRGQTLTVIVVPTAGTAFTGVLLTSDVDLGLQDQLLTTTPSRFSITIPAKAAIGVHTLVASGGRSGQRPAKSLPIHLDVEPSVAISKISVEPEIINFHAVGNRIPLRVAGTFADGSIMDITKSSGTLYSSGDPTAATVDCLGIVTASINDHASKAIKVLEATAPYELGTGRVGAAVGAFMPALHPVYVRGEAYLGAHQDSEAATEFQKILDYRGVVQNEPIGALAHLEIGRAYAMQGDTAKAKAAYQDFLALWTVSDPDIPILKQAKAEYAKLQ